MNKEYYKALTDFLKNIITALFVAELGLIGYFFTHNYDILSFCGITSNTLIMFVLCVVYMELLKNLLD